MRRRTTTLLAGSALVLAACGSGDSPAAAPVTDGAVADSAPAVADEPSDEDRDDETGSGESSEPAPDTTTAPPSDTTSDTTNEPAPDTSADAEPADAEPPIDVRAADGCSADNAPTETDVADGPAPTIELRPASAAADSPLPDLAVRRVNCGGGWVNLRNELPGDVALLVWAWAPH